MKHRAHRPGFSVVELMFSIAVVFLLMGLILGAVHFATRTARGAIDLTTLNSVKMGMDMFKKEFGFFPAMVKDQPAWGSPPAPLTAANPKRPVVYTASTDAGKLRNEPPYNPQTETDLRFSIYSLAYYLMGGLDETIDGKAGLGFTTPTGDGWFTKKGRTFEPFFDTGKNANALLDTDPTKGLVQLRDSNGVAFRYYRWLPDTGTPNPNQPINEYLNVPVIVGDPEQRQDLRSAEWAIVGAGRDGLFGDEHLLGNTHPQFVTPDDMVSRLQLKVDASNSQFNTIARTKAQADNVVVIGGSR